MFQGVEVEINGITFILPPLGLEGLKNTFEMRQKYGEMSDTERLDATVELFYWALIRNYPDLTLAKIKKEIHAHEIIAFQGLFPALMEKSGMTSQGEESKGSRKK